MERGFLSQKGSRVGRGVKEKSLNMRKTDTGIGLSTAYDGTRNEVAPVGDKSIVMDGVTPSMMDKTVEKDKLSSLEDTTVLGSFLPLPTPVTTLAGNAPGKSSYANITGKPSGKKVNVRTLFTPGGNGIDLVVPGKYGLIRSMFSSSTRLFSFQFSSMDGLDSMFENGPWSSYARVMVELRADVELKDNIVMAMPKITMEGHYTCNVRVEYEWKPPRCSSRKVFGHIHEECMKNTGAGEKKTVKKPCQTSRGVPIGPKIDFKPQKEYRHVPKKPNAGSSGNKKKGVEPTIEVSNSNPFDVLNLVDNDGEFGTNGETTNLVNFEATSSKLRLLDNEGNPLVPTSIMESDSEVEVRDSYMDNDDYDPYDDDMYENHDLSEHLQSICDDLDITVRGRKK
uniref:Zinc knuckle CX2CX4HX4C n=1 Tax=Tanacetum cinerariifolium TaxID=118510 RepID=A0A6L2M2X6_TANCI|nr:hypothetical protein [Tanacetum cinerariifolium]